MSKQIKNSQLEIFEEAQGGNNFMFIEGHDKFYDLVAAFAPDRVSPDPEQRSALPRVRSRFRQARRGGHGAPRTSRPRPWP
jgi:hypothetical protein